MATTGTIQAINYTPGSGLATVVVLNTDGDIETLHCDASPLFRALNQSGAGIGTRISYETTHYGTMSHFWMED